MISCLTTVTVLGHLATTFVCAQYLPKKYHLGLNVTIDGLTNYSGEDITLDASSPVLTLDYGFEIGGFPFFEVDDLGSQSQVELKYS